MGNCYSADHIDVDHIHSAITCNIEEPKQKYRLGTVSNRLPSNFIAGRPKAGLLFCFFGDFRRGVLLFMVILVIYKCKNR